VSADLRTAQGQTHRFALRAAALSCSLSGPSSASMSATRASISARLSGSDCEQGAPHRCLFHEPVENP
jgi:hypothetical protein